MSLVLRRPSSLNPPTPFAADERLDLGHAHPVEITRDRVLETRCRGRELERLRVITIGHEAVNEPDADADAAAVALKDVGDLEPLLVEKAAARRHDGRPSIDVGAPTLAQRDHLPLEIRVLIEHALAV